MLKKDDTVFIRATYSPAECYTEGNMIRVVTASEGAVVYVSPAELIVPDQCDGNTGGKADV